MQAGFIGLGSLGTAMVTRLADEGIELLVWNRTRARAEGLNAARADSPMDMINRAPVVILNLFDSTAVNDVLTGPEGIFSGDCRNKLIIDTTTNHFETVTDFHQLCADHDIAYIEAPVAGSVVPTLKGRLAILVSGRRENFERALPYLKLLGQSIFYLEAPGLATKMKLINNLVLGTFMATLAEAVVLGEKAGLNKEMVLDILGAGAGNSGVLSAKRQKLLDDDFGVHFSSAAIHKDLALMRELATVLGRECLTGQAPKDIFARAIATGMGADDFSGIYRILKK